MNMPLYAGFDLGGTQIKYGLIDEKNAIVFKEAVPTPSSIGPLMELFRALWERLKKLENRNILAVGFGFPGIFSQEEQKILQSPNYAGLDGYDLRPALSRVFEVPFWIDNDANLAAYGEWACGAGRAAQSLILLTLGTGVGSGIILDGRLWHGKCGFAGELGHITVNPEGERCNCSSRGCLETEAAAPPIVRNYLNLKKTEENISAEEVYRRAKIGDRAALESFARAGYYLGIGLGIAINLLKIGRAHV